jgi:hypothetical protein
MEAEYEESLKQANNCVFAVNPAVLGHDVHLWRQPILTTVNALQSLQHSVSNAV